MTTTRMVSAGIALVLAITFSLHAQETAIMVPSAQSDSIVQIAAESQGLQPVSPADLPIIGGTFWWVMPGGDAVPAPCAPLDLSGAIFQISSGQFLVDETGEQVAVNPRRFGLPAQATSSIAAAVVAAQADALVNLITQVQTVAANQPVRTMARAMGMDVPSPGDGQLFAYTFGTNQLLLEITNLANGLANLNLHNATNQVYAIWCTTNLLADWNVATEVWPTNAEVMPCTVPTLERQNLFLRAEDWTGVDANGNGLPDWWEFKYFGYVGVDPDSSPDGNGQSLLYDYQNGFDPTDYYNGNLPILTVLTGNNQIGLPNQFLPVPLTVLVANTNGALLTNAPVTLTVAQGGGSFASIPNETTSSSIQLRTDTNGQVAVWFESSPVFSSTNYAIVLAQSGTNITQTNFTEIAGAIPMNAVGGERIMALTASGDVVSRGGNLYGELGDYTFLDSTNPVHVVGLTNIVKIASGLNHALAIDSTGALWAWGDNEFGQLGDGGMEDDANVPVRVLGMTNAVMGAAGGYSHSVVFKADGTVWTWGYNESGQLGVGNTDNTNIPVQVEGLPTNAVAVAAGYNHTLVLLSDGTVWAWGDDFFNQLGDGLGTESDTPVQVPGLTGIAAICAGGNHNLALDTNGNAWAWGSFILFQPVPNIVFGPPGVAGKFAKANAEDNGDWPAMVAGLTNVVGLAAGASHSLLLDNQGRLWAWGSDDYGQLGDGGPDNNGGQYDADLPIQVRTNIISIAAGSDASVVLDGNGNVWQCGNSDGDDPNWQWGDENGFPMMAPQYVDFYSGQLPGLKILNGNNQAAHTGLEFPQLLFFQVTDPNGAALSNVPVSVEVIEGDMALRTVSGGDNYKGLRLTTDANGEVSLTGYANRNFSNPNCFVRVLAASREQIAEADFNETLLPLPTISITSPTTGSSLLIGPNQTLTITVDAGAAPGASIQEVDYYYGTNGTADTLLGVLTQSPYSFIWTNSLWWTNAFVGQYTLSAVAVDNTGGQSDPQSVAFTVALDSDGGGLPDWWQLQYFGQLGMDPNSTTDGSGHSLLYDYQNGIDPNVIAFTLFATNHYVNQTTVPLQINLQGAVPGYIAVLVNDTNLADASWQSYTGSNVLISLGSDDGDYDVWIGLRGWMTNSQPVWQGITFTLDRMPPTLAVTNPAITLVSQPVIQLQGYASEPLASLIYDLTNAAGLITNQTGYITGQYADTNLWNFTTNYFQCYDVPLTNGVNTLTLHATDLAGNTTTTNVSFTLDYSGDTTPPVLTLVWPQDGTVVGRSSFTLQAQVDDATAQVVAFIVDANGDTNTVQGLVERNGLVWAYNLPLAAGMNTLTITATDAAGNSSVTNISLFQSSVTVTMNPLTSDQLNQSFVSVSGTVSDATAQVFVNGVQATVNSDGTWSADHVPVNPGGTAVFDVEVYSGSSSLAVSNLKPGRSVQANDTGGNTSDEFPQIKPPVVQAISYECKMTFRENITLCGEARSGDYSGEVVVIENVQWNNGGSSSGFVSAWDTDGEVWNFLDYYLPGEQPWVNFSSEISGPSTVDLLTLA